MNTNMNMFMEMYMDMDMETDMDKDKDKDKDKDNGKDNGRDYLYGLWREKVVIQIKKIGTNSGSEEPEFCFYQ